MNDNLNLIDLSDDTKNILAKALLESQKQDKPKKSNSWLFWIFIIITGIILFLVLKKDGKSTSSYVSPSVDKNGKLRKGHIRNSVSTDKDAAKNRARSRYYYETHKKHKSD